MLSQEATKNLKEIIRRDRGVSLSDAEAEKLGVSLLRLTRLAVAALARADEDSSVQAREENSLGAKTTT
jgi:hypothetical protein